jgi:hypothetical protein
MIPQAGIYEFGYCSLHFIVLSIEEVSSHIGKIHISGEIFCYNTIVPSVVVVLPSYEKTITMKRCTSRFFRL